jgi:hypothetical protein
MPPIKSSTELNHSGIEFHWKNEIEPIPMIKRITSAGTTRHNEGEKKRKAQ